MRNRFAAAAVGAVTAVNADEAVTAVAAITAIATAVAVVTATPLSYPVLYCLGLPSPAAPPRSPSSPKPLYLLPTLRPSLPRAFGHCFKANLRYGIAKDCRQCSCSAVATAPLEKECRILMLGMIEIFCFKDLFKGCCC